MPCSIRASSVVVSWSGGRCHSDRLASSGQIAVDRAPADRSTRRTRSATCRESAPPLQSSTTSSGLRPDPAANRCHADRDEPGPQPQQQGCLTGAGRADHDLVGPQPPVRDAGDRPDRMLHGADHGPGHDVAAAADQRHRAWCGDPCPRCPHLMAPLPQVEGDRRVRGQPAGARFHREDPVRPGEPADQQSGRYRDGRRGDQTGPGRAARREPPQLPPGPERRTPGVSPLAGAQRLRDEEDAHHGCAPRGGAVQPCRWPAEQPGQHVRVGRDDRGGRGGEAGGGHRRHLGCRPQRPARRPERHPGQIGPDHGAARCLRRGSGPG